MEVKEMLVQEGQDPRKKEPRVWIMKQMFEIPKAGYTHCDPCFFSFNCLGLQTFDLIFLDV